MSDETPPTSDQPIDMKDVEQALLNATKDAAKRASYAVGRGSADAALNYAQAAELLTRARHTLLENARTLDDRASRA